jgi:hypothetical protein
MVQLRSLPMSKRVKCDSVASWVLQFECARATRVREFFPEGLWQLLSCLVDRSARAYQTNKLTYTVYIKRALIGTDILILKKGRFAGHISTAGFGSSHIPVIG